MDAPDHAHAGQHIVLLDGFDAVEQAGTPPTWLRWTLLTLAAVLCTAMIGLFSAVVDDSRDRHAAPSSSLEAVSEPAGLVDAHG